MFAIRIAPTQSGHGSAVVKSVSARGSNDSAESARIAFTSACARRVRPIWPGAGSSQIRLRPCATTTPWMSAIAAPTGTVPAAYAAQACSKRHPPGRTRFWDIDIHRRHVYMCIRYMPRVESISASAFGDALEKALRSESGASLLLVDLDNLVLLNEKAGRDSGDKAIAAAARTLANRAKAERWTFGRVGGDEFALVAPGLSL